MRINKALALGKVASRRNAEKLILQGKVRCNGIIVTELGTKITKDDVITVENKEIVIPFEEAEYIYVVLNKPIECISSVNDPEGRRTVISLLSKELQEERIYPIGRLDYFSEGLLLLTNDGDITYTLTHPKHHVVKEYVVTVRALLKSEEISILEKGFTLSTGEELAPMETSILYKDEETTTFSIILHQGINRQIRRICKDMGWIILTLERVRIGSLSLYDTKLKRGEYSIVSKEYLLEKCIWSQ